ncbi:MAG: ATP-binding protein, partial [Acetobacter sp.]|nr:ATP-binding protein [Acetobacter sp.]
MTNADEDEKSSLNQDNVVGVGGDNVEESWLRICACLRREVGESEYRVWLEKITLGAIRGDELILLLPDSYLRDTVRDKYGHRLSELWLQENKNLRRINFSIGRCGGETLVGDLKDSLGQDVLSLSERGGDLQDSNNDWQSVLDKRFTFDTFVVGKPNEFAYACARRVAEMPASVGFNPFFLYGSVGLGKTHLMHAIGAEIIKTGQRSVAYMSAEKFMYRFIAAIRSQSIIEFKEQLRSVNILMIDDIQFLIGKDNTQEEFFHTFNAIVE